MSLQPNETFRQALQERSAAKALGNAAADRVRPIFEQFNDQDQRKAFLTLIMQIAAAVAKNGQSPDIMLPYLDDFLAGAGSGGSGLGSANSKIPRVSSRRPDSIAGD
jgi:hypothetical protein